MTTCDDLSDYCERKKAVGEIVLSVFGFIVILCLWLGMCVLLFGVWDLGVINF